MYLLQLLGVAKLNKNVFIDSLQADFERCHTEKYTKDLDPVEKAVTL